MSEINGLACVRLGAGGLQHHQAVKSTLAEMNDTSAPNTSFKLSTFLTRTFLIRKPRAERCQSKTNNQ